MKRFFLLFLVPLVCSNLLKAQDSTFVWRASQGPQVFNEKNELLTDAFTGGMLYPRFAGLDVNLDGLDDIIEVDFAEVHHKVFIAEKNQSGISYHYDNRYADLLPSLRDWVIVYDYDHDNRKDIFTYATSGSAMSVYHNISENGTLAFEQVAKEQMYQDGNRTYFLRVVTNDVPVIEDIDGDGDMDMLTFDQGGANVTFYQNQSVELYGHPDTLDFRIATDCWGRFQEEDETHRIRFAPTCFFEQLTSRKHQGSNMLAIDYDDDGDMDMLLSDIDYEYVTLLENGWNPKTTTGHYRDTIIAAYPKYPSPNSFNVPVFPSLNYLDVDDDGVRDLVLAPSDSKGTFNTVNNWFFKNHGQESKPDFRLAEEGFLHKHMLDLGEFSRPEFFDYDADGDLDLFVGAPLPQVANLVDSVVYRIVLFENTGTPQEPIFKFKDNDYLGLSSLGLVSFAHTFGDANNDGTVDLLLGTLRGRVTFYPNKNDPGQAADFGAKRVAFMKVDVIGQGSPFVYDLNGDGKNDLLVGDQNGSINYFEWSQDSLILKDSFFGNIQLRPDTFGGNASPTVADFDGDGLAELMVGTASGEVFFYDDIDVNREVFEHTRVIHNNLTGWFASANLGANTQVTAADLNADGLYELVVGGRTGGLLYFDPDFIKSSGISAVHPKWQQSWLYPNPSKGAFKISSEFLAGGEGVLRLYALDGREVAQLSVLEEGTYDIPWLGTGTYLAVLTLNSGQTITQKIVLE